MQGTRKMENFLICLSYLFGAFIILGQVLHYTSISSAFFHASFVITLLLWLLTLLERFDEIDLLVVLILVLSFTNVAINGIASGAEFSFDYVKKLIMFDSAVVYFALAGKIDLDEKTCHILKLIYIGIGLFLVIAYLLYGHRMYLLNGQYTKYLTFQFTNPNLTAVFLCCMAMFLCNLAINTEKKMGKVLMIALACVEIVFVVLTRSRNGQIAVFVFIGCMLGLFFRRKQRKCIPAWILGLIAVAPLLFAGFYMKIVQSSALSSMFSFLVDEGKQLDSRVDIWRQAMRLFTESPIIGAYYQISNGTGTSQLHNTHIDILASYGVAVFVLICFYLYKLMLRKQKSGSGYFAKMSLAGFVCVILLGCGEATVFSGGLGGYLFAGVFLFHVPDTQFGGQYHECRFDQQFLQSSSK